MRKRERFCQKADTDEDVDSFFESVESRSQARQRLPRKRRKKENPLARNPARERKDLTC